MYNISTFYPSIYEEKFKNKHFLNIDSGWIISNKNVYLDLNDLNLVDDLGHILDFYRKIDLEGYTYRINIVDNFTSCMCKNHYKIDMCISCNKYICKDCKIKHINHTIQENVRTYKIFDNCSKCYKYTSEPMVMYENKKICYECYECCKNGIITTITYTKPVIERLNLYEWIPINNFLENRNINSHLYKRKMSVHYDKNKIDLKLLDINSTNLKMDYISRKMEKYKIDKNITNIILKMIDIDNELNIMNKEKEKEKEYKTIVISN